MRICLPFLLIMAKKYSYGKENLYKLSGRILGTKTEVSQGSIRQENLPLYRVVLEIFTGTKINMLNETYPGSVEFLCNRSG